MLKLGIIGYPLEHTLSPVMHTAALQHLNINGSYRPFEVTENELEKVFNQLKASGIKGLNVTIPYKKKIISLLDELTETAKLTEAVNTVIFYDDGRTVGHNTDVVGFYDAVPEYLKKNISNQNVSIFGCGGAANAVSIALLQNRVKSLKIYGRDPDKLLQFKTFLENKSKGLKALTQIETELIANINLSNSSILINTTPVGMYPDLTNSPVTKNELAKLNKNALVYDLIYNPRETLLLEFARALNLKTLNGAEMLIRQGAASLATWLNQNVAPVGIMRLALNYYFETHKPSSIGLI